MFHVSCDGPNINLSFLDLLEEDGNEKELSQLVQIGTCDLHTLHSSMEDGEKASGWNVKKLLTSLDRNIFRLPTTVLCKLLCQKQEGSNDSKRDLAKVVEITDLSKSKKQRKGKIGANTSYEHLYSIQKDLPVPLSCSFLRTLLRR